MREWIDFMKKASQPTCTLLLDEPKQIPFPFRNQNNSELRLEQMRIKNQGEVCLAEEVVWGWRFDRLAAYLLRWWR